MARRERVGNIGYLGLAPQTDATTPVAATDFIPLYEETITTNRNLQDQDPVAGNKYDVFDTIYGQRSHQGDVTVLAEPNTAVKLFDMLLTRGGVTGSDPYTWPLTLTDSGEKYYTLDISTGNIVKRFFGVQASKITPAWQNNEMQLKVSVSALGSFAGREIASISGSGPYTIVFKTDYDNSPTKGLVADDLIRLFLADGSTIDCTVDSVVDGTSITTTTDVTAAASGDFLYLRPATVAFDLLPTFKWSDTEFRFGSTASAALSASQLQVETGSIWELDHNFNNAAGEHRSGSQDPASLARTTGMASLTVKKFFDTPEDVEAYNNLSKQACVIRHFAYSGGKTYELRITLNSLVTDDPLPQLKSKQLNMSNIKYHVPYNSGDGQGFDVKVLNALASIS